MKRLLILFFLTSCAYLNPNVNTDNSSLNFNRDLTFDEFDKLLIKYAESNPYPNIDK